MRELERIDRICDKLKEVWKCAPDQRLGQFLSNFIYGHHVDIWYKEDTDIEKILDTMLSAKQPCECAACINPVKNNEL